MEALWPDLFCNFITRSIGVKCYHHLFNFRSKIDDISLNETSCVALVHDVRLLVTGHFVGT